MQREIKFRGQKVDTKEWVHGSLIKCGITGKHYIFPIGNDANESDKIGEEGCLRLVTFEVNDKTVGQYTGLKDKNGQEIYEGDIVSFEHTKSTEKEVHFSDLFDNIKIYNRNYAVEFVNMRTHCGIRLRNKSIWFMVHAMTLISHNAEIIGNIYDNPELLQEV